MDPRGRGDRTLCPTRVTKRWAFELFRAQTNVFHPSSELRDILGKLNRYEVTRDLIAWLDGVGQRK